MRNILLLIFSLLPIVIVAQNNTGVVRGKIVDKQSKYPLEGVTVLLLNSNPPIASTTDVSGEFKLSGIPIGRNDFKILFFGYNELILPNILVNSGKEVYLNIELEEQILELEDVKIETNQDRSTLPVSDLSVVSTRKFSFEETNRYAGSRNDPARMAMNFAGVTGTSDARNDIIIRGNSPLGVLWRMDGVDIPNPNHFGSFGTTGGPVSMLNNNVLSNSDFMTGAWPAPYGNALAGVFDLQMRKGNNQKREYMGQMGFNGAEAGVEGPFSKKKPYSYLVNYRYSTLGIFKTLGIKFGTSALPEYQDLNFKLNFPTEKAGTFTVFGIGGISKVSVKGNNVDTTDLFSNPGDNTYFISHTGVVGISNTLFLSKNTFSRISIIASGTAMIVKNDSVPKDPLGQYTGIPVANYRNYFSQTKYSINYVLNHKFSTKNNLTSGVIVDFYHLNLVDSMLNGPSFTTLRDFKGNTSLVQAYSTWQHRFNEKLTLNAGLHYQFFTLNGSMAVEPRTGLKYQLNAKQSLSFGYGLHSQLQPFQAYFEKSLTPSGNYIFTNKDLKFTKSHQIVAGYIRSFPKNFRLKTEVYYQYIFQVPIEKFASSYSMLNSGADFVINTKDSLVNKGTGKNYGIEMTFEKLFTKGFYFLTTTSIYNSKYKGSDGVERNTAFNGNFTANLLLGKEFKVKEKNGITVDFRSTWAGGRRYTPVDLVKSKAWGREYRYDTLAYSQQLKNYFRIDVKVGYRHNGKKVTQEWSLDIQNVLNRKNAFIQKYNRDKQNIVIVPQLGIFPVVQYRVTF